MSSSLSGSRPGSLSMIGGCALRLLALGLFSFQVAPAAASPKPSSETATINGAWEFVDQMAPSHFSNLILDSHRRRLLGFGYDAQGASRGWALAADAPAGWNVISVAAPTAISGTFGYLAAFDPENNRAVFVRSTTLWQLTLAGTPAWSQVSLGGPAPPGTSRLLYDPSRNRIIGADGTTGYALDLSGPPVWTLFTIACDPTFGASADVAVYDAGNDRFVFAATLHEGSQNGDSLVSELTLTGTPSCARVPTTGPPPFERVDQCVVYDPVRDRAVVFGGFGNAYCAPSFPCGYNTYAEPRELTLGGTVAWNLLTPIGSGRARYGAHAVYDRVTDRMFVQGGWQRFSRLAPPTALWDTQALNWSSPDPSPDIDTPRAFDLGLAFIGWPRSRPLAVWNQGLDDLDVTSITCPDPNVTVTPSSFTIAGAQFASITIQWTPPSGAALNTTLTIASNDPDTPARQITLTATASPPPVIGLDASSLDFGTVPDLFSYQRTFTVSNSGTAALNVAIASADPSATVEPDSFDVAAAGSRLVTVTWASPSPQVLDADLTIGSNDPVTPSASVHLDGTALAAQDVAASPSPLAFPDTYAGESSTRTLTVSNAGAYDLVVTGVASSDPAFSPSVTSFTVMPGQSQDVAVQWSPPVRGVVNATLTITSNDPDEGAALVAMTGSAPPNAVISTDAESIHVTVPIHQSSQATLRITNTGIQSFDWFANLETPSPPAPAALGRRADASRPIEILTASRGPGPESAPAPRSVLAAAGGPDAFGHSFHDSDFGDDLAFDWLDVRAIGTAIQPNVSSPIQGPFPIGFAFPFYGQTFTQFWFSTYGYITFTNGSPPTFANTVLPSTGAPENLLAIFWDALSYTNWTAYYHSDGSRLVVQYQDAARTGSDSQAYPGDPSRTNTFEAVLLPDGTITYQYADVNASNLQTQTIGIQNGAKNDGLQVAFDAPYLHGDLAVRFHPPLPFVTATPVVGALGAGAYTDLALSFVTNGVGPGDHDAVLRIRGSDPLTPMKSIPVRLTITAIADARPADVPQRFGLRMAGPNPAAGASAVELAVPRRANVEVRVYDVRGALVRTLERREFAPGRHAIAWDGRTAGGRLCATGIYFVRAVAPGETAAVRVVRL